MKRTLSKEEKTIKKLMRNNGASKDERKYILYITNIAETMYKNCNNVQKLLDDLKPRESDTEDMKEKKKSIYDYILIKIG